MQNVASVFDDSLVRQNGNPHVRIATVHPDPTVALYEYRHKPTGAPVIAFWDQGYLKTFSHNKRNWLCPTDSFETRPIVLSVNAPIKDPVWVDMMTGKVYEFPRKHVLQKNSKVALYKLVPMYDSPCLLTDRSVVLK